MRQYRDITDPSLAKALVHPLRTRILGALEGGRMASPSELADEFDVSIEVVSYHVRRLAALRFLKLVKRVPRRGALEHYYTAIAAPMITSEVWGATPSIVKQVAVSSGLQEISRHVNAGAVAGGFEESEAHMTRTPVIVDRTGFNQIARELDALLVRIEQIEAESAKRLAGANRPEEFAANAVLLLFRSGETNDDESRAGRGGASKARAARKPSISGRGKR